MAAIPIRYCANAAAHTIFMLRRDIPSGVSTETHKKHTEIDHMAQSFPLPTTYPVAPSSTGVARPLPTAQSILARLRSLFPKKESEIGAFIKAKGGAMTDELEREISRRFGRASGF
ncbi:MAG: hypothetical protein ACKVP7_28610 [Hyphomicrobiaceae bacterium]